MTDGDGQRIGGVRRLWNLRQIQQPRDHVLHLLLLRFAVADHGRLNGERRVLGYFVTSSLLQALSVLRVVFAPFAVESWVTDVVRNSVES